MCLLSAKPKALPSTKYQNVLRCSLASVTENVLANTSSRFPTEASDKTPGLVNWLCQFKAVTNHAF